MHRQAQICAGTAVWALTVMAAARLLTVQRGADASTLARLARFYSQDSYTLRVNFPRAIELVVGDDVEIAGDVAGEVEALLDDGGRPVPAIVGPTRAARVRLYDRRRVDLRAGSSARYVQVPQTAAWVVQTLMTKENVPRIAEEWNRTMLEHREAIFELMTPIVRDLIIDVERQLEAELRPFVERHRPEVTLLGESMQRRPGGEGFADFFENQIWPIAQPRVRPLIESVSDEVWRNLPLWSFGWRLAYQTLPLTDNDYLQKAWIGFLERQVLPILKSRTDEFLEVTREVARDIFARDEVAARVREVFADLLADPGFHALSQSFLREVFLDNPRFHEAMRARWSSPEVQHALEVASAHIEPMMRRIGDIVLGTREEGITKEFARVLRSQILLKDLQRIVIDSGPPGGSPLPSGTALEARIEWELAE